MSIRYLSVAHAVVVCGETVAGLRAALATVQLLTNASLVGAQGDGLGALLGAVAHCVRGATDPLRPEIPAVTRARHRFALETARRDLASFRTAWPSASLPAPVASVHVKTEMRALDELVGTVESDDVFELVFSTFCVGKQKEFAERRFPDATN